MHTTKTIQNITNSELKK